MASLSETMSAIIPAANGWVGVCCRMHRIDLGLTQKALAYESGISNAHLSNLESGKARWTKDITERVFEEIERLKDNG